MFEPGGRHAVTAQQPGGSRLAPPLAAVAPDIAVIDIVIVGNADAWRVTHDITECPEPQIPFVEIIQFGLGQRFADNPSRIAFVNLIAREEEQIRRCAFSDLASGRRAGN